MMYGLTLVTPPAEEPFDLAAAKLHLREDDTGQDSIVSALITAARSYCESFLNRALITQTWDLTLDCFPYTYRPGVDSNAIMVPRAPLQSVTSITYLDTNGTSQTLASTEYIVDPKQEPGRIVPAHGKSWPSAQDRVNAVVVRFVAGYGAAAAVPEKIKAAMKLLIGHWYENREGVVTGTITTEIPMAVESLLWQERIVNV